MLPAGRGGHIQKPRAVERGGGPQANRTELSFQLPALQRVCSPTGQAPDHAGGRVLDIHLTVQAALCHLLHDDRAKPAPPRCRRRRSGAFLPDHREGLALGPPANIHAPGILRQRPVFAGVGGKFVEREPDGLRGCCVQRQRGAARRDTRTKKVGEGRDLGANQVLDLDPFPFALDEQVLTNCKRPNAVGEAPEVTFGTIGDGLASDSI
jgi:hypothetical protein